MRILAISDEVIGILYQRSLSDIVGDVDVLLSCGDLPYSYMEFVVTQTRVRDAFFVHGNHDHPQEYGGRLIESPGGWVNIDRRAVYVRHHDLLIAGLQGSIRYARRAPYQYTTREMAQRALRLVPQLLVNKARHGRYLDILITHSPAYGIHDRPVGAHRGFPVFVRLIDAFRPRLFLHGHNHRYGRSTWHTRHAETDVVNVHPFCIIDLDDGAVTLKHLGNH